MYKGNLYALRGLFIIFALSLSALCNETCAQLADYSKMSGLVRNVVRKVDNSVSATSGKSSYRASAKLQNHSICAFVKVKDGGEASMKAAECRILARFGDIYISDIPLRNIASLSRQNSIERIEASQSRVVTMDTTAIIIGTDKIYAGSALPQAFTGKGVVVGSMDVGYDLTNPNFYDCMMKGTRIRRFWDQLSPDSVESDMYVGADYRTEVDILRYAHSHDACLEGHGTHTLGIAAGTGFDTPYQGVAPDAELCLVSNAVNTDLPLIPENQLYKYTSATDALGFKYIFDYAAEVGKPCVITFSEGSIQTLDGDEQLFEQVLADITGPGRIIVVSAGNRGHIRTYQSKPSGRGADGAFVLSGSERGYLSMMSQSPFSIRLTIYHTDGQAVVKEYPTEQVVTAPDSLLEDTVETVSGKYMFAIEAYRAYSDPSVIVYKIKVETEGGAGQREPFSAEAVGEDADVDIYSDGVYFQKNNFNPSLGGGEKVRSILSPGSSASVICVGATSYRDHIINTSGETVCYDWGLKGELAGYSSVGPTRSLLVKPDVVAPGTFVNSSFSSFYPQDNPEDGFVKMATRKSEFNGRTYPWGGLIGTSMSTPVVAGTIALWLQAMPTLTTEQIMDLFAQTCRRHDGEAQGTKDNYYGYGEIDAYRGLLKLLGIDGIPELSKSAPAALSFRMLPGNVLRVVAEDASCSNALRIIVYALSGQKLLERGVPLAAGVADIPLSDLSAGIYAVQVSSASKAYTGSTLIRLNP